ncbi:hypothetical protein D5S17_24990 [Pseudonocardiaceae bacterium YIM PH 21723]|nr:hypothetical protein D5S17_24990 [Pseudonocardiaceae bacterium YIM PH 21723]
MVLEYVDDHLHSTPTPSIPKAQLPAAPETLAVRACELLGWSGVPLGPITLFGRTVVIAAELLTEAHAARLCFGMAPVTDRTSVATWSWPEMAEFAPPRAVRITGVLALSPHWRTALISAVPFARFAKTAMVLPDTMLGSDDYLANCLIRARQYGVSVVTADTDGFVDLALPGREEPVAPLPSDSAVRWAHEVVYEKLLATV